MPCENLLINFEKKLHYFCSFFSFLSDLTFKINERFGDDAIKQKTNVECSVKSKDDLPKQEVNGRKQIEGSGTPPVRRSLFCLRIVRSVKKFDY